MKLLYLLLLVISFRTNSYAQDGWLQIHPGTVSWYDASSENIIFVLSNGNLQRSLDGGNSWEIISEWPKTEHLDGQYYDTSISTSPIRFGSVTHGLRTRLIRIDVEQLSEHSLSTVDEVTTDGGITWIATLSRSSSDLPTDVAFFEPSTWMIYRKQGIYDPTVPAPERGFAISTDGGMNWNETKEGLSFHSQFIALHPNALFLAAYLSALVSSDLGATWHTIDHGIDRALTPTVLYHKRRDTTFISTDEGKTWTFRLDSLSVRWTNQKGIVYASAGYRPERTFFRSLDTGRTYWELPHFQEKDRITLFDTNLMYALHDGALLKSVSGGQTLSVKSVTDRSHSLKYLVDRNTVSVSEEVQWFDLLGRSYPLEGTSNGQGWMTYRIDHLPRGLYLLQSKTSSTTIILNQ